MQLPSCSSQRYLIVPSSFDTCLRATVGTVIAEMAKKLGDITIMPLFGARDVAERVLISGRLGSRGVTVMHRGLSMNYEPVLRDGLTIADTLSKLSQK